MPAGNCWLLGKLYCEVSQGTEGSVLNVDCLSEFTSVYRAAQQGNGSVGGGGMEGKLASETHRRSLPGKRPARSAPDVASQRLL